MLETLVSVANGIRTTVYCGLYLSYKAGYYLVNSVNTIFKYFVVFLDNFTSFFSILWESSVIFIQDIFQFLQQILVLVTTAIETICSSVATVFLKISLFISSVVALISSIHNGLVNGITALIASMGQTIAFLKNLAILFGSGVWFLITFVPLLLYYLCNLCISFIHRVYQEICDICYSGVFSVKTLIKNILLFISDVPIESVAGIVIALSIAYIFSQFYMLIISYLKQQLRKLRNWARHVQITEIVSHYYNTIPRYMTRQQHIQTPRARQPVRRQPLPVQQQPLPVQQLVQARTPVRSRQKAQERQEDSFLMDDKNCVICQERNKCILLLPCRHLCLCSECVVELRYYNEVCPICRTNIESTMKIFL